MSTNTILVPHDFTKIADNAVKHAVKLIETLKGERYFVIADTVRFGRVLTIDDLQGK